MTESQYSCHTSTSSSKSTTCHHRGPSLKSQNEKKANKPKKKLSKKTIYQPPLHFDFASSLAQQKDLSFLSDNTNKCNKLSTPHQSTKYDDNASTSTELSMFSTGFRNTTIINLPSPSKPNFVRKNQQILVKADFDDQWQLFLEMKHLEKTQKKIYFKVYFHKWKVQATAQFLNRLRRKTSFDHSESKFLDNRTEIENVFVNDDDSAINLIKKARMKCNEYTSFLSDFGDQVSSFMHHNNQEPYLYTNQHSFNEKTDFDDNRIQKNQLDDFDFTCSSDPQLKYEHSFSDNSDNGEFQNSEIQLSMESITMANSVHDMIDDSLNRSHQLALETKKILADDCFSSSDVEKEILDHTFLNEKQRKYIINYESDDDDDNQRPFLRKPIQSTDQYHKPSLADSFNASPSRFASADELNHSNYSFVLGSDTNGD